MSKSGNDLAARRSRWTDIYKWLERQPLLRFCILGSSQQLANEVVILTMIHF